MAILTNVVMKNNLGNTLVADSKIKKINVNIDDTSVVLNNLSQLSVNPELVKQLKKGFISAKLLKKDGGTYIEFEANDGSKALLNVTELTKDTKVTAANFNKSTNVLTLLQSENSPSVEVDLSKLVDVETDNTQTIALKGKGNVSDKLTAEVRISSVKDNSIQTDASGLYVPTFADKNKVDKLVESVGSLSSLSTTQKATLVGAINEVFTRLDEVRTTANSASKTDDSGTSNKSTWSSNKITSEINQAITGLINGADADSDTLKELADKITALAQADNGLVSATDAQSFSPEQQAIARDNIDAASSVELQELTNKTEAHVNNVVSDIESKIAAIPQPDLTPFITREDAISELANKANLPPEGEEYALVSQLPDITGLATKEELNQFINIKCVGTSYNEDYLTAKGEV